MIDATEDIEVTWARRRENVRGVLKLIRVMVEAVQTHATLTEQRCAISATQLWALWELDRRPGMRCIDVAKSLAIHASTARTLLRGLLELGLVSSTAAESGPNSARLSLTEAGRHVLRQAPGAPQGVITAAVQDLDDAALDDLIHALQPLLAAMQYTDGTAALTPLADMLRGMEEPPLAPVRNKTDARREQHGEA